MTKIELVWAKKLNEGMLMDSVVQTLEIPFFLGMRIEHEGTTYFVRDVAGKIILVEDK